MKFKLLSFLLLMIVQLSNAQETVIYDAYPYGQEAYLGGKKKLYNDIHNALIENKIQKCQDSTQSYKVRLIVKQDASILFVKNPDTAYVNNNKCAYEMSKNVLNYLNDWKAAEHKIGKLNAIYEFDFYPSDLFDDYDENYIGIHIDKNIPQFPGGLYEFGNQFKKKFVYPSNVNYKGIIKCEVYFKIGIDGTSTDLIVKSSPQNFNVERSVLKAVQKIKTKWILPSNYSSFKELFRVRFPVSLNFD